MDPRTIAPPLMGAVLALSILGCDGQPNGPTSPTAFAVSSVTPNTAMSGVIVTINGSGFRPGVTVTFDGVMAEVVSVFSYSITARTPELAPGRVDVVVTNPNGESATVAGGLTLTPPAPPVLSGTVLEFTTSGLRGPVPNLRLKVRWGGIGQPVGDLPDVVTDANGRYSIPSVPASTFPPADVVYLGTAPGSEYRSFCNAWPLKLVRPFVTDLPVVHNSWSGNRLPPGMWTMGGTVKGVVSERVDGRSQPIEGATVYGEYMETATTSASGFYMNCTSLGHSETILTAFKPGYIGAGQAIELGFDFEINFELTRNQALGSSR